MSNTGCRRDGVADVLRVLQAANTAIRKHPGGDPRMRLEGFLADLVSTLVDDNGRGDVESRCLVPYIPASWQRMPS